MNFDDAPYYGGEGGDVADALQEAVTKVMTASSAVKVLAMPSPQYLVGSTVTVPYSADVSLRIVGSGRENRTLVKRAEIGADHIIFDVSGEDQDNMFAGCAIENMTIDGNGGGPTPLVRAYYTSRMHFENVRLAHNYGPGYEGVVVYDSQFDRLRLDFLGDEAGNYGALILASRSSDTSGAFGYSDNSPNQIDFNDCALESGRGGIWLLPNWGTATSGSLRPHMIQFNHLHAEQSSMVGPLLRAPGVRSISIRDSYFYQPNVLSGASAMNLVEIGSTAAGSAGIADSVVLDNVLIPCSGTTGKMLSGFHFENTRNVALRHVHGRYTTGKGPSVALIDFSGTNTDVDVERVFWQLDPDTLPLFAGSYTPATRPVSHRNDIDGHESMNRDSISSNGVTNTSGQVRLAYFTAKHARPISTISAISGNTAAAATPSLARLGLYSVASSGDLTLVARSESDTALFAGTNTEYPKALDTTGGYPSSFTPVPGQRYAFAAVVVSGTTMPTFTGQSAMPLAVASRSPKVAAVLTSQTDLPASISNSALGTTGQRAWMAGF